MTLLYMLSSLYTLLNKGEVYRLFDIEKLIKYDSLIIIVVVLGVIFLLVNYYRNRNQVLKTIVFKVILPIVTLLLGLNYPNFGLDGIIYAMVVYLIVTYIFMYPIIFCKNRECNDDKNLKLYPSRKNLMDVLNRALEDYSLIALDGTWGSGKTTFMNIVMKSNSEKYYYIPINVMLFENRNSLKTEFLNQLKGVFKEEGIFQGSLMDFDYYLDGVSNDWVKVIKNIIFSKSKSFKEANEKLKSEIGKIEKRIVVGVDNLERIYGESEPEWKQILGFINELQELGIKIVVMANLEEMLTSKKETGEKDLFNHEYFDKFYEFKLKLNEVTTEEIINEVKIKKEKVDQVEIKENTVDKEWLKEQIKELMFNLDGRFKSLESKHLSGNKNEEEKKESKEKMSKYRELQNRYLENIVNPRKIEKLMKDVQTKKETIKNIFNFIDDGDEYDKLVFKASMFSLFYFDLMKEIDEKYFSKNFLLFFQLGKKSILDLDLEKKYVSDIFYSKGNEYKVIKRLLYYDIEDDEVKKRIENLKIEDITTLNKIEKALEDLSVYHDRLDPDYNQETTKETYKIIEEKLIELEKTNENKIHKIIKENEEFICRMNYLCNPNSYKLYKESSYKFETQKISMQYRTLIDKFNSKNSKYNNLNEDIYWMISSYYIVNNQYIDNITEKEIVSLIDLIDERKSPNIIMGLKDRSLDLFFSEEAERVKLKRMIALLNILKIEINKQNMENRKEGLIITVEEWKNMDNRDKFKALQKLEDNYCYNYYDKKYEDFEKVTRVLEKIIEKEKSEEFILKLESLIESLKIHEFPCQIIDMASKLNIEQDLEKKIELIDFINEKAKIENYKYIYSWDLWIDKVKEIGIEVDLEKKKVFLKQGK